MLADTVHSVRMNSNSNKLRWSSFCRHYQISPKWTTVRTPSSILVSKCFGNDVIGRLSMIKKNSMVTCFSHLSLKFFPYGNSQKLKWFTTKSLRFTCQDKSNPVNSKVLILNFLVTLIVPTFTVASVSDLNCGQNSRNCPGCLLLWWQSEEWIQ